MKEIKQRKKKCSQQNPEPIFGLGGAAVGFS
jgi:hypothetical protein